LEKGQTHHLKFKVNNGIFTKNSQKSKNQENSYQKFAK